MSILAAWLAIVAGGAAWGVRGLRLASRFRRAVESLGLQPAGWERYSGFRSGWRVTAEIAGPAREDRLASLSTRLAVRAEGRWPAAARVRGPWERYEPPERRGTLLGPDAHAEEEEAATLALMDPATKAAWTRFAERQLESSPPAGASIRAGELTLVISGRISDPDLIGRRLDALVAMAEILDRRGRSVARCLADLCELPDMAAPLPVLRILARRFRGDEDSERACRAALATADREAVIAAAPGLRDEARPMLESIVLYGASSVELRLRAMAEWEWGPAGDDGGAAFFAQLVASPVTALRRAALLSRHRPWALVPLEAIEKRVGVMDDDEAALLAEKLGHHRDPRVEPLLAGLLERTDAAVRGAALGSLGTCGTLASVPAILPLSKGLLVPADVQRAARLALAEIRSRLGPVEAGRLSFIEGEGLLSLPRSEGGALSVGAAEGAVSPADGD